MVVMSGDSFTPLVYHRRYEMLKFSEIETQHWREVQAQFEEWYEIPVGYCSECGEPINEGEEVYAFGNGEMIHEDCLDDWAYRFKATAHKEDPDAI